MLDSEKIIGIDLVRIDGEDGIYGIYESVDGGEEWRKLAESKKIYDLLQFAKNKFSDATPMVLPQQIQNILTYEIMEEAADLKRKKAQAETPKLNWFVRLLLFFKRG
jgi:hypothetical protein